MSKTLSDKSNLQVLYEDNHIIIVNKRAGDIVQGVKDYIKDKYNKPGNVYLGVTHRLDRPTTGIVVFAKTSKALPRLNKLFSDKKVQKTYWAVVKEMPPKDKNTLIHWLNKNPKNNKSTAYNNEIKESKKAILHYQVIKQLNNYYLLEINLETGRHHQIRSQLASIGSPIKGDLKYGFDRSNKDASIHLHSRKIEFTHPVSKVQISVIAPTSNDPIWDACND